jgi:N-acetylglutamate synthase-like GNAT family acetyltransferase
MSGMKPHKLFNKPHIIRRPCLNDWDQMLSILKKENFDNIGGEEMRDFPLKDCFIAACGKEIIGLAGYKILDSSTAKTSLIAVKKQYREMGIGILLQNTRIQYLRNKNIKVLYTNCDNEKVISWNIRHFGFKKTGKTIAKTESYGLSDKDEWVSLKLYL